MISPLITDATDAVPVLAVGVEGLEGALAGLNERERRFAIAQGFKAEAGRHMILPDEAGNLARVLFGLGASGAADRTPLLFGKLASSLPAGSYRLDGALDDAELSVLAFALGGYRFDTYRKPKEAVPRLTIPEGVDRAAIEAIVDGVFLTRDLINTPANDLSPHDLARAAAALADRFGADIEVVDGEPLAAGFPMVHAVGMASDRPPCLIDLRWGSPSDPKVTLVGKGIVFDTGGLDIKPSSAMLLMKKDMGGAANVLGLALMIMQAHLKVRLRVLIPAAENAISGRAFRPGDVLRSRKGLTVEIGNTDAEGRLVLADALTCAEEESPELLVTMSTLTGAARVALGPDLPPFYTDDDALARGLEEASARVHDPIWRMPFWMPYDKWLGSKVADLNHISSNAFAGSIVAALFLKRFVTATPAFVHFDIFGWTPSAKPGSPEGGEAQAIRALFRYLTVKYPR